MQKETPKLRGLWTIDEFLIDDSWNHMESWHNHLSWSQGPQGKGLPGLPGPAGDPGWKTAGRGMWHDAPQLINMKWGKYGKHGDLTCKSGLNSPGWWLWGVVPCCTTWFVAPPISVILSGIHPFSFCNLCPGSCRSCRWHVSEPGVQHEGRLGEMIVADQMMPIGQMPKAAPKDATDANLHQRTLPELWRKVTPRGFTGSPCLYLI